MPTLTFRYSGVSWYLSNSSSQCASLNGGSVPSSSRHSTMDRPERVRRVVPPSTTMKKIIAATMSSHRARVRRSRAGSVGVMSDFAQQEGN